MARKFRSALLGLGNIGYKFSLLHNKFLTTHWEAYLGNKQTDLVAVADPAPSSTILKEAQRRGIRHYTDYHTLLKQEQPEIVSIATPDTTHFTILKAALNTPSVRGIWCEKPLALSLVEAQKMVAWCQQRKVALLVNFVRRYDPFYRYLKKHLSALVGEVKTVTFYYSGGIVTTGSHLLDLLLYLFGPADEVSAEESPAGLVGRLRFGKLWVAIMPIAQANYTIFEMNIFGSKARLDTINKPFGEYAYRFYLPQKASTIAANYLANKMKQPISSKLPRRYMEEALSDLVLCLKNGQEPFSSGKSALASLELMHALLYSAEHHGQSVHLPFTKKISRLPKPGGDIKKIKL